MLIHLISIIYLYIYCFSHLLAIGCVRSEKPIALAVDGGRRTPTNGVHFPMRVVIVHHVEISMPAPANAILPSQIN